MTNSFIPGNINDMAPSDGEEKTQLTTLPRELRDEIYQEVFETEEAELTSFGIKHKHDNYNLVSLSLNYQSVSTNTVDI